MGGNIQFANPEFFWLLLILPVALLWYYFKRKEQSPILRISSLRAFRTPSLMSRLRPVTFVLRLLALAAVITAMARPQIEDISTRTKTTKGIDIVMAIDVS
ncbi:MAG: BatA domain-containing protein, partial [Robiginitalea sp.]